MYVSLLCLSAIPFDSGRRRSWSSFGVRLVYRGPSDNSGAYSVDWFSLSFPSGLQRERAVEAPGLYICDDDLEQLGMPF